MRLRGSPGFTLLECVAAAAVLLIVWVAVSGTLVLASRARADAHDRATAELAVTDLVERLRSLPLATAGETAGDGEDVVRLVFPHSVAGLNTEAARFEPGATPSSPAGSFVTRSHVRAVDLETRAWFVVGTRDGWVPCDPAEVGGRPLVCAADLPSPDLVVLVSASWRRRGRTSVVEQRLVLHQASPDDAALRAAGPA
jgi:type II secretory pathway pseudopilin PulG